MISVSHASGYYWPPIGRTADGRMYRAMLESGARVPPHWLEAVHSRLRAAQVVQVSKYAHSNRLLAAQLQSSAHPLSCLIELSCDCHWHAANTGLTFRSCNRRNYFGNRNLSFFRQSRIYLFRLRELSSKI